MKKLLLIGSVALSVLSASAAHATETYVMKCGNKLIDVYGHHGWSYTELKADQNKGLQMRKLPSRWFHSGPRGCILAEMKCHPASKELYCNDKVQGARAECYDKHPNGGHDK